MTDSTAATIGMAVDGRHCVASGSISRFQMRSMRLGRKRRRAPTTSAPTAAGSSSSTTPSLATSNWHKTQWNSSPLLGLILTAHTAEPATASADALSLLASWAATETGAPHPPTAPAEPGLTRGPD